MPWHVIKVAINSQIVLARVRISISPSGDSCQLIWDVISWSQLGCGELVQPNKAQLAMMHDYIIMPSSISIFYT
jgi:hypothetical protein